ncbi:hypothetical protein CH337_22730, partial [Rhodoblastus acidophilus]
MRRVLLVALSLVTLLPAFTAARAENLDPEERYSYGRYTTRYSGGASSIARSSVSFDASYAPGTIVVNT